MKLVLFFLVNIFFSSSLHEWIDLNRHIIESESYKISFNQKFKSIIGDTVHSNIDTATNVIIFRDAIRYEDLDRVIIANPDSFRLLNKNNNQLFIDFTNHNYKFLLEINPIKILSDSLLMSYSDNCYYMPFNDFNNFKIYFLNKKISIVEIWSDNFNIELSNIHFHNLDTISIKDYFSFEGLPLSIFDLRDK